MDIVLIILLVIALIYGIYKGFAGVLLGFIGTLVIAVALGVGLYFLAPNIMFKDTDAGVKAVTDENGTSIEGYTDLFMLLYNPLSESFINPEDPLFGGELVMVDDILQIKVVDESGEGYTTKKFSVAVQEMVPSFGSKSEETEGANAEDKSIPMLDEFITKYGCEGLTVGHALAAFDTLITLCLILWFVLLVVLIIVKAIIRRLIFRTLDRHSVASKIDRAVGAVVAVAVVVCVAWLAISIAGSMGGAIQEQLDSNPICGFIAEHPMFGGSSNDSSSSGDQGETLARAVINVVDRRIY